MFAQNAHIILVFGASLAVFLAIYFAANRENTNTKARLKTINKRREYLVNKIQGKKSISDKKESFLGVLAKSVFEKSPLDPQEMRNRYTSLLLESGFRDRDAVIKVVFFKLAGFAAFLLISFVAFQLIKPISADPMKNWFAIGAMAVFGFYLPDIYLKKTSTARKKRLTRVFPDALDLMVVCSEAGLGLDATLKRVSQEIYFLSPDLAEELGLTSIELTFFEDRREAMLNFSRRTGLPAVRSFVSTMLQTERYGTPVASSLRVLSNELREERMTVAEERAAKLGPKMTLPMMVFIMPAVIIVTMAPPLIKVFERM